MKKILSAVIMFCVMIFSANCQAESDFDLNKNFNEKLQPTANFFIGRVVGIKTYLSIRERPTVNSGEIMRIPNGTALVLNDVVYDDGYGNWIHNDEWYEVQNIFMNGRWYNSTDNGRVPANIGVIGYVSSKYVIETNERGGDLK